jgi:tetratricopeptide (TPR) repeat protein
VYKTLHSASYAGLKQWTEAMMDAKECIRLNPEFMKGYYRLATAQLELEDYDAAQATIKQGLSLEANNSQLLKVLKNIKQAKKAASNKAMATTTANGGVTAGVNTTNTINGATSKLDDATRQEVYDLQVQHAQTTKEYNTVQANLTKIQREFNIQELTHRELSNDALQSEPVEEGTTSTSTTTSVRAYYRTIGKVFYKSTKDGVLEHLQSNMDERQKKQVEMKQKLEYLERRLKSQQQNIQELIGSAMES